MRRASIIGLTVTAAAALGVSGVAAAAGKAPHKRSFTAVAVGAQISASGNWFETVYG